MNKLVIAIFPHASDLGEWFAGTLSRFSEEGWSSILCRVTNDDLYTAQLSTREEAEAVNAGEFYKTAEAVGSFRVIDLGYRSDEPWDMPLSKLCGSITAIIRKFKPHVLISFDAAHHAGMSLNHVQVARAASEAVELSGLPLAYTEHFDDGLEPHVVYEYWTVINDPGIATHAVDVSEQFDKKVQALCASGQIFLSRLQQLRMQLAGAGESFRGLEAVEDDEAARGKLADAYLRQRHEAYARAWEFPKGHQAELFNIRRFGDWEQICKPARGVRPAKKAIPFVTGRKE